MTSLGRLLAVKRLYVISTTVNFTVASMPKLLSSFFFYTYSFAFCTYGSYYLQIFARIMDKHLKALAPAYVGTEFVKLDAEVCILSLLALNYFLLSYEA